MFTRWKQNVFPACSIFLCSEPEEPTDCLGLPTAFELYLSACQEPSMPASPNILISCTSRFNWNLIYSGKSSFIVRTERNLFLLYIMTYLIVFTTHYTFIHCLALLPFHNPCTLSNWLTNFLRSSISSWKTNNPKIQWLKISSILLYLLISCSGIQA